MSFPNDRAPYARNVTTSAATRPGPQPTADQIRALADCSADLRATRAELEAAAAAEVEHRAAPGCGLADRVVRALYRLA